MSSIYLVLIPLVVSSVSPVRRAKDDGSIFSFAILIMLWHCSIDAKLGKYNARGNQLKTYPKNAHIFTGKQSNINEITNS